MRRHGNSQMNLMKRSARWRQVSTAAICCAGTVKTFRPRKRGGSTHLSHTRRECLPLYEEPAVRASHFSSPRAPGGIAYLSVRLGVPLVGCHRDDVGATRDP